MEIPKETWTAFAAHYEQRLNEGDDQSVPPRLLSEVDQPIPCNIPGFYFDHPKLRPGNGPRILYHGESTADVIILTHGFTDSPFYMQAVAESFFLEGVNVVLPLLPAHGLKEPDALIRDEQLDTLWRATLDHSVEVAEMLGERISIGGFSTGGALSLNKILRSPGQIEGGLFLFSAALSLGKWVDKIGNREWVEWTISFFMDKEAVPGDGPDPYKYPVLPLSVASEIVEIIRENNQLLRQLEAWRTPVFAAHSHHDETTPIKGVADFLEEYVSAEEKFFFEIEEEVMHAALPLRENVPVDLSKIGSPKDKEEDRKQKREEWLRHVTANPLFGDMMGEAIAFFRERFT
ncbi:MAG: lysophospholipase [Saprospiraceae bacterium]|nr:lysophospholipase [Saprospiraceae bacterium]